MPTPIPIPLASIVTVTSADVSGAITTFWAIPAVGAVLLFYAAIRLGPKLWLTVRGLFGRR